MPKNENEEFAKGFKKFHLLYQCWMVVKVQRLITCYQCFYILQVTFESYFYAFEPFFQTKYWEMELRLPKWKQIIDMLQIDRMYLSKI